MHALLALIKRLDPFVARVLKPLVVVLSLAVAVLMVSGIVSRELLGQPLLGLEEVVLTSVMWLYMLGAALASRDRTHLSGDFIQVITQNESTKARMRFVATLISLLMAIVFAIWSFSLIRWGFERQQSTAALRIPLYVAQSSLFVCSVLMVFYAIRDALSDALALGDGGKA
ncbi:MAG: TRAP transporter small permease [Pseudomonadota bacterium]